MNTHTLDDTIAAIATSMGEAGIGIVRISGKESRAIADEVFLSKEGRTPSEFAAYTVHYGWIVDGARKIIDEVLLTVMRSPRSFTREDVVEISGHGGMAALRRVLELVLENGARLAEPGEFTKRAFLNGRIDLAQAEAVLDIIRAKTDAAREAGIFQLKGALSSRINAARDKALSALAQLEARIDFPEEEISAHDNAGLPRTLEEIDEALCALIQTARYGRVMREGVHAVICGRANVGKSSLLNALLRQERSIVTAIPGTTRDTIEEIIDIKGIPVRIVDTAGILEPRDLIEKKAVARSKQKIAQADLVILLFDGAHHLTPKDRLLMARLKKKPVLAVINKIDMKQRIDRSFIAKYFGAVVEVSAKRGKNINLLEDAIERMVLSGGVRPGEPALLSNTRHILMVKRAQKHIAEARVSLDNKLSEEFIAQFLKEALGALDELVGKKFSEGLLDTIFSEFCIGK